jgi:CRISPR/Cas system CMR subunit Cmr4 (Cas7 group RAMP superfamily)
MPAQGENMSPYNFRHLARITIEFTTPVFVGAGHGGDVTDAQFVTDANSLPAIPGSSLAGAFRAAFKQMFKDEAAVKRIFGDMGEDGCGSRLLVSWACVHDSKNIPVEGICAAARRRDAVLANALAPVIRDHVRISHQGAAKERGKFDEQPLCPGHRFTFELELLGNSAQSLDDWNKILEVVRSPLLRLGGKTRRGYGAFKVVDILAKTFDLNTEFAAYQMHPASLCAETKLLRHENKGQSKSGFDAEVITLKLNPTGYWMFGGGSDIATADGKADAAPVRCSRIVWDKGVGKVEEDNLFIPATGLKGAISHRVAFHYNALKGWFADKPENWPPEYLKDGKPDFDKAAGGNNPAVKELFGCDGSLKKDATASEKARRGRVIMDDICMKVDHASTLVPHIAIDRFTSGVRDGALFNERPLWKGEMPEVKLMILGKVSEDTRKAFTLALEDLSSGRLQVGAGHGRGNGRFSGEVVFPKGWLD